MPTKLQSETSRKNGARGQGPKTPEGKARSSRNALKHGLSAAKYYVVSQEDQEQFDQLLAAYADEHQPSTQTESDLVHTVAVASWRLRRVRDIESGTFNLALIDTEEDDKDHYTGLQNEDRLASAFANRMGRFDYLARYEARIERSFYRALHELQRLKAEWRGEPVPPPQVIEVNQPEPEPPGAPAAAPEAAPGFVLSSFLNTPQAAQEPGTCQPVPAGPPASDGDNSPGRPVTKGGE